MFVKDKKLSLLLKVYVIVELILLFIIRLTEYRTDKLVYDSFMYTAIVIDFLMIMFLYLKAKNHVHVRKYIPVGFFFMLLADTFLCLIDQPQYNIYGYIFFCLVEITYALYLKPSKVNVIIRIVLYGCLVGLLQFAGMLDIGNAIAILNVSLLIVNMICGWQLFFKEKTKQNLLFAIGITLFFVCDGSIVVRTIFGTGLVHEIFAIIVWTAYIPAQIFLLFSYLEELKQNKIV